MVAAPWGEAQKWGVDGADQQDKNNWDFIGIIITHDNLYVKPTCNPLVIVVLSNWYILLSFPTIVLDDLLKQVEHPSTVEMFFHPSVGITLARCTRWGVRLWRCLSRRLWRCFARRLWRCSLSSGILPVNFGIKWLLCTCISTAQAGTKSVSRSWSTAGRRHLTCKFPHQVALVTCPSAFQLHQLAQSLCRGLGPQLFGGILPLNCRIKWLVLWHVQMHFDCTGSKGRTISYCQDWHMMWILNHPPTPSPPKD